jgi:hypothetical protein
MGWRSLARLFLWAYFGVLQEPREHFGEGSTCTNVVRNKLGEREREAETSEEGAGGQVEVEVGVCPS